MNREHADDDDDDGHPNNETQTKLRDQRMLYNDRDIQRSSNLL